MGNDVLPGNDAQFEIFQAHFITTLTKSPAKFGVTAEDVAALAAAQKGWSVAYPAHLKAQQDAQAATQTKNTVRGSFEAVLRMAAQKVSATAGADNSLRLSPVDVFVGTSGIRGRVAGAFHTPQAVGEGFSTGDIVDGQGDYAGRSFVALRVGPPNSAPSSAGTVFVDTTGPWR